MLAWPSTQLGFCALLGGGWMNQSKIELDRAMVARARQAWCPHTPHPKQRYFLGLTGREALYGGAAGGGKSDALIMEALRDVDTPGYSALALRRSIADLRLPGAIMNRAIEWLAGT